jgi:cellulose synthase/poly-beta-1,6-N-acetylglucosamine synthase-like glycosyltransferase
MNPPQSPFEGEVQSTSLVICTSKKNYPLTLSCLRGVKNQTRKADQVLLVVDTEEEKEFYRGLSRFSWVEVYASEKTGLSAARNTGIERSIGDVIAFLDDDAVPDRDWLRELMKPFDEWTVVAAGGPVHPWFVDGAGPVHPRFYWMIGCIDGASPKKRPIGCNMAFRKEVFRTIGLFNTNLGKVNGGSYIGEETEILLKIEKFLPHYRVAWAPKALVNHTIPPHRTTLPSLLKRAYCEGKSKARIARNHSLQTEKSYLTTYLHSPDPFTLAVLGATGLGFLWGKME